MDLTERFVIEVGRDGTASHIIDLEGDPPSETAVVDLGQEQPGTKLCNRGSRWAARERVTIAEYADMQGTDRTEFEGDAPNGICSYCWSKTLQTIEEEADRAAAGVVEEIGTVGYRLRWKQKGRAREEWYDVVVRPETTMAELDRLVCRFTTLDDEHLRLYGLEDEYLDSSIGVLPDHQCEAAGDPSNTRASEMTIGELAEIVSLWDGDRLSLAYDLSTPSYFYCIVKNVYDPAEVDALLESTDVIATTDTAAIIKEKRP